MAQHIIRSLSVIVISFIVQACTSTTPPSATQGQADQILDHCGTMRNYGIVYAQLRTAGHDKDQAKNMATRIVAAQQNMPESQKLQTIFGIYSAFIELLEPRQANTTGYFVLAQCLSTHGRKKTLPLESAAGRTAMNRILARCEETATDEDSLGACVLNGLRPLANDISGG